jgi:hypothetical protein
MKTQDFPALVQALARHANTAHLVHISDHAHLQIDDTAFTLIAGTGADNGTVAYFCHYGTVASGPDRAQVLQQLLLANELMFGPDTPAFAMDPQDGQVLLIGRVWLDRVEAPALLRAFISFSAQARAWRQRSSRAPLLRT